MPTESNAVDELVPVLQRSVEVEATQTLSALVRDALAPDGADVGISAHSEDSSAYGVGDLLTSLDRELRRSQVFLLVGSTSPPRRKGEVEVLSAARSSSIDLWLGLSGTIANVLLSDPLQVALTLSWFWERRPSTWGSRRPEFPRSAVEIFDQVSATAQAAIAEGQPVTFHFEADEEGGCRVEFRSGGDSP